MVKDIKKRILFFLLPATCLLIACGEDRTLEYADRVEDNEWIYATMEENYYYLSSMRTPKWYALPENFFQGVRSNNEARNGSYISQLYLGDEPSYAPGYGYVLEYYSFDSLKCVRVLYVAPQSPASEAGLQRGDWITGFDGKLVGDKNYTELSQTDGGAHTLTIGKVVGISDKDQPIIRSEKETYIPAPRILTASPVEKGIVLDWCDRKVGYLLYTRFESGPEGGNELEGVFNDDLRRACADFAAQGVKEMVLDLRFTTGNAFYCAQLLGTMLAPKLAYNEVFFFEKDRNSRFSPYFLNPSVIGTGANLDLSSLYVIATSRTMGAAELLMHALSRYVKVVILGSKTQGNDLLAETFQNQGYGYSLKLATRILVRADSTAYSTGITPKVVVSEKDSLVAVSGKDSLKYPALAFGNPKELLLKRALEVMKDSISAGEAGSKD